MMIYVSKLVIVTVVFYWGEKRGSEKPFKRQGRIFDVNLNMIKTKMLA